MQIFILDGCPRKAARRLRSRKMPGKMLVEALQLLGKALRVHSFAPLDGVYDAPNPSHPCAVWVSEGRDAFLWTLAHARELHTIFDLYCRRRCDKCHGYKTPSHASLKALERIEQIVRDGNMPASMPDKVDSETFYLRLERIRDRQPQSARKKSGSVVRVAAGLPAELSCIAMAIDGAHQETCLVRDADGSVNGIASYNNYHSTRIDEIDAPWLDSDANDDAVPTHCCACGARRGAKRAKPDAPPI
jgi:hypothetical protein